MRYLHPLLIVRPVSLNLVVLFVGLDDWALRVKERASPARGIVDAQEKLIFASALPTVVLEIMGIGVL